MASLCAIFVLMEGRGCWTWILFLTISEAIGILDFILKCPGESLEKYGMIHVEGRTTVASLNALKRK